MDLNALYDAYNAWLADFRARTGKDATYSDRVQYLINLQGVGATAAQGLVTALEGVSPTVGGRPFSRPEFVRLAQQAGVGASPPPATVGTAPPGGGLHFLDNIPKPLLYGGGIALALMFFGGRRR